jgi:hypothetical protein
MMADVEVLDHQATGDSIGTDGECDRAFAGRILSNRLIEKDIVREVAHWESGEIGAKMKHQRIAVDRNVDVAEVVIGEGTGIGIKRK